MNRRAQFFSIAATLIILLLVIMLGSQVSQVRGDEEFRVSRATASVMDGFARNFASLDVPHTMHTASRLAIVHRSNTVDFSPINEEEFVEIMQTGSHQGASYFRETYGSDAHFERVLSALPFSAREDMNFNYSLLRVEQFSAREISFTFNVSYTLSSDEKTWFEPGKLYVVTIGVEGIRHPAWELPEVDNWQPIIDNTWAVDDSGCLAALLFDPVVVGTCSGNVHPPQHIIDLAQPEELE